MISERASKEIMLASIAHLFTSPEDLPWSSTMLSVPLVALIENCQIGFVSSESRASFCYAFPEPP